MGGGHGRGRRIRNKRGRREGDWCFLGNRNKPSHIILLDQLPPLPSFPGTSLRDRQVTSPQTNPRRKIFHLSLTHCHLSLSPRNFFEGFLIFSESLPTEEVGDPGSELCVILSCSWTVEDSSPLLSLLCGGSAVHPQLASQRGHALERHLNLVKASMHASVSYL